MPSRAPFTTVTALPPAHLTDPPAAFDDVLLPADRPLLLLPVRLETRFAEVSGTGLELRVRVFPDTVHLDSHEPDLTPGEQEWGRHYWEQDWRAGSDEDARAAAWQQLADRFGAERAAWVARCTEPANAAERPAQRVAPDAALVVAPVFGAVALAEDDTAWRRAPQARLLPDRWHAVLSSGGRPVSVVTGRDIGPLAVGPDPRRTLAPVGDDELAHDPEMAWMVDFDAAEAAGMGLRVPIAPAVLDAGIDALHVLGARAAGTPEATAAAVADLLDAHHHTDGLEVLRAGTASNSSGSVRSGFDSADPGHRRTFAAEVLREPASLGPASDAARLGGALGLGERAPGALGRLIGADGSHDLDQRSMGEALWEASWGYFLSNLYGFEGTGLTPEAVERAREHAARFLRAGGPFPALRVGRQPYGIVPVTSLDLWHGADHDADAPWLAWLRDLLVRLRDGAWREQLGQVARLGRRVQPPDPDADVAEVMHADGLSSAFRVRAQFGRHYFEHLRAFMSEDLRGNGFIPAQDALAQGPLRVMGLLDGVPPRVSRHVFDERAWGVTAPVAGGEAAAIAALLAEPTIAGIAGRPATTLLQALLRHALLREYAVAAARMAAADGAGELAALLRDAELVDLVPGAPETLTWQRLLDRPAPAGSGAPTIRAALESLRAFERPEVAGLGAARAALAHLQALDDETLRRLVAGTLDAAGHRLDAWVTSFATRRLDDLRAASPAGLGVGGYGWVENLAPGPDAQAVAEPPAGEEGDPLVSVPGDTGFIHAPSATHAVTAALLRNAHLGPGGAPAAGAPFAVTLSSWSAREASALLEGVRQGQPLGALLGYRFERSLHDARLDRFVRTARELAPLVAGRLVPLPDSEESIAANDVVDGLGLFKRWTDAQDDVEGRFRDAGAGDPEVDTLRACIKAVGESIDALADALTAETAFQAARGNLARAAGTLDAIARGATPPPELEVTRFPRSGVALTHRLAVLLGAGGAPAPGWAATGRPRAAAEPALEGWTGRLLGDPRQVRCSASAVGEDGAVLGTATFALSELGLGALDAVHTAAAAPPGAQAGDLEALVLRHAAQVGASGGGAWRLDPERPAGSQPGELALDDLLTQARAVHALLAGARAADAADFAPPHAQTADGTDVAELEARVGAAEATLAAARDALAAASDAAALEAGLLGLAAYGIPGAVPPAGAGEAVLAAQARTVLAAVGGRLEEGARLRGLSDAADAPRRLDERMRAVFGPAFLALPQFSCPPERASELRAALDGSTDLQGGDPLAVSTWLVRAQRVRAPVDRFAGVLGTAEILGTGERLELAVAQLPASASERWVGLPLQDGERPPRGTVSVVVHRPEPVDVAGPLTAVFVDEWVETVPDPEETTAITFQCDPPSTAPPQSLLLAVPPIPGQPWTVGILQRVLAEAFDLAKLRAVPPDALSVLGQYLPAVFLALNADQDAVSTDLGPLTREGPT